MPPRVSLIHLRRNNAHAILLMPAVSVTAAALILHYLSLTHKQFPRCRDPLLFLSFGVYVIYLFVVSVLLLDPEDALKYRFIVVCSATPVSKRRKNEMLLLLKFLVAERQLSHKLRLRVFVSAKMEGGLAQSVLVAAFAHQKVFLLRKILRSFCKFGQKSAVVARQACRLQSRDVSASLGKTPVFTCCSLFSLGESPARRAVNGSQSSAAAFFFSFFFLSRSVPEQSEVLRQYVCPFSSASLDDNRTQTLSASLGTGVLKRLLQRCTWHRVLFLAAAHNSSVKNLNIYSVWIGSYAELTRCFLVLVCFHSAALLTICHGRGERKMVPKLILFLFPQVRKS